MDKLIGEMEDEHVARESIAHSHAMHQRLIDRRVVSLVDDDPCCEQRPLKADDDELAGLGRGMQPAAQLLGVGFQAGIGLRKRQGRRQGSRRRRRRWLR